MGIGSWAGLWFALGIPVIVILYLFKRKFIDTPVASHLLWRRALENTEANRPWQKLRSRLLMWLQLLAAALLAFALMRPFVWAEAGGGGYTVVVADVSASMSARFAAGEGGNGGPEDPDTGTRLDEMKRGILADTNSSGGGLTLIRMGGSPQVIESGTSDRGAWEKAVRSLSADYGRTSYREAISLASAVAEGQEDARIVVYTDAQWNERVDDLPVNVPIEVRRIGSNEYRNASVEQFGTDASGRFVGVIANTGTVPLELRAEWSGDGRPLGSRELKLEPGKRQTVTFDAAEAADAYRLSLADAPDDYAADDDAFAFAETGGSVNVLLLSGGNLFLEKALRLSGAEVTRLDLSGRTPPADGEETAAKSGAADAGEAQSPEQAPPLPQQRPDLVVVEGELPSALQSGEWGKMLSEAALWTIGGPENAKQPGSRRAEVSTHPVTRYLTLSEPYFGPLAAGKPAGLTTIFTIGEQPAAAAGTTNGRRTLWFGFDLQKGDLPLNSEFPVLVSNAVSWLSGGRGGGLGRVVSGAAVDMPIAADAEQAVWRPLQGPAFGSGAQTVEAQTDIAPNVPGLYAFEQIGSGSDELPAYLLDVRPDVSESAAPAADVPVFGRTADTGEAGSGPAASGDTRGRLPLTAWLAALIAAIMLTEWGVYRRGRSI